MRNYLIFLLSWTMFCACDPAQFDPPTESRETEGHQIALDSQTMSLQLCGQTFGSLTMDESLPQYSAFELGAFLVELDNNEGTPIWTISHPASKHPVWQNVPGKNILSVARGQESVTENRGSLLIEDEIAKRCHDQTIDTMDYEGDRLVVEGILGQDCDVRYVFVLTANGEQKLDFDARIESNEYDPEKDFNRLYLLYASNSNEHFFGFGTQYTHFDMKGRRVPIIIQEQGIGRGKQPFSLGVELTQGRGVSGDWHTSYAAVPHYISNQGHSLFLKNTEYSVFDLRQPNHVEIEVFSSRLSGQILADSDPLKLVELYTEYAGRMQPLPGWMNGGAIVGIQGGTETVQNAVSRLNNVNAPLAGVWLQDWVGKRETSFGSQLWWNWELDEERYPNWDELVGELNTQGVQVLSYINPFLVDVSEKPNADDNLFEQAKALSYLVKNQDDETYLIQNTSFSAGLIDLTNPEARDWLKEVIRTHVIETGVAGWMADFGEALPWDAVLSEGEAGSFHNQYATEWAKLNREVIEEAGLEGHLIFFSRSGFTQSPTYSPLMWLGDQLVTWDERDGIKTAVTGLISSGLSGFSLNHSDIGGYTTISNFPFFYHRSKELFMRWAEMNAFTAVYRTHEGNRPEDNHQYNSDQETLEHFARFARIYKALSPYRQELMHLAASKGHPLVRPLFLHYPNDEQTYSLRHQFMLGPDFVVAPVLTKRAQKVNFYLPEGRWQHVWTGAILEKGWHKISAPIGRPAVFFRASSPIARELAESIAAE